MNKTLGRESGAGMLLYGRLYKFLIIFLVALIVIDNYIEYPEVVALILLLIKFTEQKIGLLAENDNPGEQP